MKRVFAALGVAMTLSLSACAGGATNASTETTRASTAPAATAPSVSKMYGKVVRITKPTDGVSWVHVGVQRDGESTWRSFYCNEGICYNLEKDDSIAYTVDFDREILHDIEVTGNR